MNVNIFFLALTLVGALLLPKYENLSAQKNIKNEKIGSDTFPIPIPYDKFLFYLQRTSNTNTIMYELNLKADGSINEQMPVHTFWLRYAENGNKEELNYVQRKYAYGLNFKVTDREKLSYKVNFVSYSKKDLYLFRSVFDKKYHIYTYVSGKLAILNRIFIKIDGGSFWIPNIKQVEIYGKDVTNGKPISEIFKP